MDLAVTLSDPVLDSVRQDPRFIALMTTAGLPKAAWGVSPIGR